MINSTLGKDLTVGSIPRHLINFAVPLLIANLLTTGYSIINMIWVGNILGTDAVGATADCFPILFIIIGLAVGATMATSVLVSQYYGAKNYTMVEKVVNNSVAISLIMSAVLTIAGVLASDGLLRMMDTPVEIFPIASGYLKINLAGFTLMYLGTLVTSILRGMGDTKTPLLFMVAAVVINAVLDPLLIIGIGPFPKLGLNGAAYASLFSQAVALVWGYIYLNQKNHIVAIRPGKLILEKDLTLLIFKIGFPSMIQQTLVSIGSAFITSYVNVFGAVAIAGFGAASRIDSLAVMPALAVGMAVTSLTGQNLGAGKPERIKEIFQWGLVMASVFTLLISLLAVLIPGLILRMFVREPEVLTIGIDYLRIVGASYLLFSVVFVANGVINGAGQTVIPMLFSLFSLWVLRVPLAAFLSRTQLGITGIWLAIVISFIATAGISYVYYHSGRWKKVALKHPPEMSMLPEIIE
jgi:putative MATE family efflux protein